MKSSMRATIVVAVHLLLCVPLAAQSTEPAGSSSAVSPQPTPSQLASELLSNIQLNPAAMKAEHLNRDGLTETAALYGDGKYADALNAFYAYYQRKARTPQDFGLSWSEVNPFAGALDPHEPQSAVMAEADNLMYGSATLGGTLVKIGEPGQVNWNYPPPPTTPAPAGWTPDPKLFQATAFLPLAHAYLLTHDVKYLNRWAAYIDDWYMNSRFVDSLHPCFIPDAVKASAGSTLVQYSHLLLGLAAVNDTGCDALPRVTLEIETKFLNENIPAQIAYVRSNTHNWTPSADVIHIAMLFDEFKVSPFIFREGRRRFIEDNATTQNLRDGAENQQDPWYNAVYPDLARVFDLFADRMSLQADVPWVAEIRDNARWASELRSHLTDRVNYQIHIRTPQGEMPIPFRGGDKRRAPIGALGYHGDLGVSTSALADPVNSAILDATSNPNSTAQPPYTSDWLPFAGFNVARDGWSHNSGYGAMFTSPEPGAYGAYRSRSDNNSFGMSAYGQDLIVDDTTGHYMYPLSPLTVDGKNQFFHAGIYKVGPVAPHKVYQVDAWLKPANYRWHSSDSYNLMEGVYSGPYGELAFRPSVLAQIGTDESAQTTLRLDQTIRGVTHQRLAIYVRAHKLWVITDRILSAAPHTYEQVWFLPVTPSPLAAFDPADIHIDGPHQRISTSATTFTFNGKSTPLANVSLYQFTDTPPTYSSLIRDREAQYGRQLMYGYMRVGAKWNGKGNQQIITAIMPRAPGTGPEGDLRSEARIKSGKSGLGFKAITPDGATMVYLASSTPGDRLNIGNLVVHGESLLVCGQTGIALDCDSMSVDGHEVSPGCRDFEFAVGHGKLTMVSPIYRPIQPVNILPDQDEFTDSLPVTMSCPTQGIEIRYTTDGTIPTPQSTLYTKPIVIEHTGQIIARAYRPGQTHNPYDTSETQASVSTTAYFDKAAPIIPAPPLPHSTAGLICNYYEADWKQLLERFDDLTPLATAKVSNLWDFSVIPADNPPLGAYATPRKKYYALEYTGYLNIPADAVYVFEAPHEWVWPDQQSGYDLRLYVGNVPLRSGGLNEWYPATRLHAFGNWSIALKKGMQPFRLVWIDYRTDAASQLNVPGLTDYVWTGVTPKLLVSGPGLMPQPIPVSWFVRAGR